MGNVRPLNSEKYEMSKHRFFELYHFCMQYNEWKDELKYNTDTIGSICNDGMPRSSNITDGTGQLGIRRAILSKNCEIVEQTAIETDSEIYQYIIKAVTNDGITYNYLKMVMGIPVSHNTYYDKRRKFYWLLSQKF